MIATRSMKSLQGCSRLCAVLLCSTLFLAGCGSSEPAGTVTGTVSYQGKKLNSGFVRFLAANGQLVTAPIQADGTYTMEEVPVGKAQISVTTPSSSPATTTTAPPPGVEPIEPMPPEGQASNVEPVSIPPKYGDPAQSGLTFEVEETSQTHDIVLP